MSREPVWVSRAAVLALHERLLAEHGGREGIRDEGALDSALTSPLRHPAYGMADAFVLAAALAQSIARDHPFRDGNERLALVLAGTFLALNGWRLDAPERDVSRLLRAFASRATDSAALAGWLRESCSPRHP